MINFILGIMIGGLIVMVFMCILQINRINEMQNRINKAIEYIKNHAYIDEFDNFYGLGQKNTYKVLEILGGDVDDE